MENLIRELHENADVLDGDLPHLMNRAADKIAGQAREIERLRELAIAGGDGMIQLAQQPVETLIHQAKLLAQALGECIEAAGITRPGAELSGPELLMFAGDLKRHLETQASCKSMPEGAEQCEVCDTITARMDGDGCAKWCCCCGARLTGNYVTMIEPTSLDNDTAPAAAAPGSHDEFDALSNAQALPLANQLHLQVINCPHSISDHEIVLRFDPKMPGHNALDQLANRLAAAPSAPAGFIGEKCDQ